MNDFYDLIEDSTEFRNYCHEAQHSYQDFTITLRMKGDNRYVKCNGKSVNDDANEITGLILVFEDISESIKLSIKNKFDTKYILEDKQYYLDILNNAPYLIWEYDENITLTYANNLYSKLFGKNCVSGVGTGTDSKAFSVNGEIKSFLVNSVQNNNLTLNFAHDITELNKYQKIISELQYSQKGIINHISTAVACYDSCSRIVLYNNAFVNLFDLEQSWLNTQPLFKEIWSSIYNKNKVLNSETPENKCPSVDKIEPYRQLINLSDGTNMYITFISGAKGKIWMIYEATGKN